jgi:hypothetical protein
MSNGIKESMSMLPPAINFMDSCDLINHIESQTNLLTLNATIEAASV